MNNALPQMKMLERVGALSEDLIQDLVFIGGCTNPVFNPENLSLSTRYLKMLI